MEPFVNCVGVFSSAGFGEKVNATGPSFTEIVNVVLSALLQEPGHSHNFTV